MIRRLPPNFPPTRTPEQPGGSKPLDPDRIGTAHCVDASLPAHPAHREEHPMTLTYDYSGTVAVVTGASRGVGRAIEHAVVDAGARVVAADRDADGLEETCRNLGDKVMPVVADITKAEDAARVVAAAPEHFGRLDFCVNDAAVAPHAALLDERV